MGRPVLHIAPLRGWMNDPCAPYFDAKTRLYHIFFQWVPKTCKWTNEIGWGHAWSHDLAKWEYAHEPSLMPSESYDQMGVFTGTLYPSENGLVAVYSAINDLFQPDPGYSYGQERIAVSSSADGGQTWHKDPANPVPLMPPQNITGWRDPYMAPWRDLAELLNDPVGTTYGLLSGGIKDVGCTLFLYRLSRPAKWTYLGPLVEPRVSDPKPKSPWTGDTGYNWECGSFFQLETRSFLLISPQSHHFEPLEPLRPEATQAPKKWQLWASGALKRDGEGAKMDFAMQGVLDWGCLYAVQQFQGEYGQRLMIGWLPEDDLSEEMREARGYCGHMSSVRELFEQTFTGVLSTLKTPLAELPNFAVQDHADGTVTVTTLGVRPLNIPETIPRRHMESLDDVPPSSLWEVKVVAAIVGTEPVGLQLEFEHGSCNITFYPDIERIVVDRTQSALDPTINTFSEYGSHTLFRFGETLEPLVLRVFYDDCILEVFANDRFALSTHVYGGPCKPSISNDGGGSVTAEAWVGSV